MVYLKIFPIVSYLLGLKSGSRMFTARHTGTWQPFVFAYRSCEVRRSFGLYVLYQVCGGPVRDTCNGDQTGLIVFFPSHLLTSISFSYVRKDSSVRSSSQNGTSTVLPSSTFFLSITIVSTGQFEIGSHGTKLMVKSDAYGI